MVLSLRSVDALLQYVCPCIPSTRADVGRSPSAHTRPGHVEVASTLAFHLFAYLLRQVDLSSAAPVCAGKVCQTGLGPHVTRGWPDRSPEAPPDWYLKGA
ncbi:hypothetical protein IG631_13928 [Alternaria alternata]|nr:hypothetical protein IG631_13928 [Alternaria alternata]